MNQRSSFNTVASVLCTAIILATALVTSAAKGPKAPKSIADVLADEQSTIAAECKPTAEQQATLKEKFKAKQDALEAWDKANAEKMKAAEEAAKAARTGSDADARKKANKDLQSLKKDRTSSAAEADKAILAVLTNEQQVTYAGVQLYQSMLPRYRKAKLSDEQITKVKSACVLMARQLSEFTGDDKKDKKGRAELQKALKWAVDNVILTADQRAEMPKGPQKK